MATAGRILMFPVGDWTSGNNYGFLDITYFGGSSYIAKTDIINSTVNPATDTTNWQILAHGYMADTLSGINGVDTSGLLGAAGSVATGQALIDEIADRVSTKLIPYTRLVNNGTTTVTGQYALDGAYGKTLADGLVTVNSNLLKMEKGTATQSVAASSNNQVTITFSKTYSAAPLVMAVLNADGTLSDTSCAVRNVTATGFTLYFRNAGSGTQTVSANWGVVGL